ncbi:putative porin, partial [Acinetobacter baumannii]|uniref:putative porin n=1 Tax=Acinetobacter baumannii TaxID=470 RepID=UPI001BB463EC
MFGAQGGLGAKLDSETNLTLAFAYYDFITVQGKLSSECFVTSAVDPCDTDLLRPSFAPKGNTYMKLRNIPFTPGSTTLFQFYGLASDFRPVVASG